MKTKYIILAILILISVIAVAANPQILEYNSGHWYNDRYEEVDTSIINSYHEIQQSPTWKIYVDSPELQYLSKSNTYQNGEHIIIMTGMGTISLTAQEPITISIEN